MIPGVGETGGAGGRAASGKGRREAAGARSRHSFALALSLALAACNPYLNAQSPAPPGRSARLDEVTGFWGTTKSYRLELSRGVAIAITCTRGGPCEHMKVVSDDPAIAEVRAASLGVLEKNGFTNNQTASALVVVGKAPGLTHVHVTSKDGNRDIAVTIVGSPDPAPAVATAPARPRT